MIPLILGAALCAVVTGLVPFVLRPVLQRAGVLDVPNARSSHDRPVLRGGGIAMLAGMLAGSLVLSSAPLWLVMGAGAAAALLGLVDDLRGLSARVRFAAQLVLGALLGLAVALGFGIGGLVIPLVAVFFAGYVNVANFMDGIDGISSLHGTVVGAAFAFAGVVSDTQWLIAAGLILAAAHLAFLPWNLLGSRIFPGDSGSYLLGGFIAATVVGGVAAGVPWPVLIAPLAIYLADTVTTIARRLWRRERWWEGHRAHNYQRLVDSGLRHVAVAAYVAVFTAAAAAAGFLVFTGMPEATWLAVAAVIAVCGLYLVVSPLVVRGRAGGAAA